MWLAAIYFAATIGLTVTTAHFVYDSCLIDTTYLGFSSYGHDCTSGQVGPLNFSFLISNPFQLILLSPMAVGIIFIALDLRSQRKTKSSHSRLRNFLFIGILVPVLLIVLSWAPWALAGNYVLEQCTGQQEEEYLLACSRAEALYESATLAFGISALLCATMLGSAIVYWRKLPNAYEGFPRI
jgi:hypothetical protein